MKIKYFLHGIIASIKDYRNRRVNKRLGIISETEQYFIFRMNLFARKVTARRWKDGTTDIKFDNSFAIAMGFNGLSDLLDKQPKTKEMIDKHCPTFPEWLVIINGEFHIRVDNHPLFSTININ